MTTIFCQLVLAPEVALGATKLFILVISADDPGSFTGNGVRLNLEYNASKGPITQVADVKLLREGNEKWEFAAKYGYQCK